MTESLSCAIYEYLAKTPCKLLSVSLDDIIGKLDQQNMPGVTSAYPSWIQKNSLSLENIMALPVFSALSEIFRRTGRGSS
jgi:4-alpha-glucanotransferase